MLLRGGLHSVCFRCDYGATIGEDDYLQYVAPYLEELGADLELGNRASLLLSDSSALLDTFEEVMDGTGDDAQLLVYDVDIKPCPHGVGLP